MIKGGMFLEFQLGELNRGCYGRHVVGMLGFLSI